MNNFRVCRACLSSSLEFRGLKHNPTIVQAFWVLANVKIELTNDKMPQTICSKCVRKFTEFDEFREEIIKTNKILIKTSYKNYMRHTSIDNTNNMTYSNLHKSNPSSNTQCGVLSAQNPLDIIKEQFVVKKEPPTVEVFETSITDINEECYLKSKKKNCDTKSKKLIKSKKKNRCASQKSSKTPRRYVEIDPSKISVIELSRDEQMNIQQLQGLRPSYLAMPFKCQLCYKGFNFERKLRAHTDNFHKSNSEFSCEICSRTMSTAASLALHLKKHKLVYQCNVCFLRLVEKPRAIAHFKSSHEGIEDEIPCKHCDKVFRNRSTLNGHIRSHHPISSRPECEQCHKSFASADSLLDHMLIHTGKKDYTCSLCEKRFRLKQSLLVHMLSHSSSRSFYCIQCDVSFKSKAALVYHTKTTTKHVPPDLRDKNACSQCGRTFTTAYRLRVHSETHSESRFKLRRGRSAPQLRFICHHCGYRFVARRSLERHLESHLEAGSYVCQPHNRQRKKTTDRRDNKDIIIN